MSLHFTKTVLRGSKNRHTLFLRQAIFAKLSGTYNHLVAIIMYKWMLQGLGGCYGVYVLVFFN